MEVIYQTVQGAVKPLEIDVDSSPKGVYIRRNIEEIEQETKNAEGEVEKIKLWQYQEAYLSKSEFEQYSKTLIVDEINGEENSQEYEDYKRKLKAPVQYKNGKYYKTSWLKLYSSIIDEFAVKINLYEKAGGDIKPIVALKTAIYDITAKLENAEMMSVKEVVDLWLFLYQQKEQYFKEYKEAIAKKEKEGQNG